MDFKILNEEKFPIVIDKLGETKHYADDRDCRKKLIAFLGGYGSGLYSWFIENRNRKEFHTLTTNGMIVISNVAGQIVTTLVARPNQIRRYFNNNVPKGLAKLIDMAKEREENNFNN